MKIRRVEIRNFRSFPVFDLEVNGESLFVIGENGGGKSTLLTAIARALGRDLNFTRADFADPAVPVELRVFLTDLDVNQQGVFAGYANFGAGGPTLTMETRSVWDASSEGSETEHTYPTHAGSRSKRDERDSIPLQWLPANRDAGRMLDMGIPNNLMGRLLDTLPLNASLGTAITEIQAAGNRLAADPALGQILEDARGDLESLVPDVQPDAFTFGVAAVTPRELLRQLELVVKHLGEPVAVERQSSGIAQLAVFVFAIMLARRDPGRIMLIDEPEISLHPQAQRSLIRALSALNSQMIVATHSPSLLDRADPRKIVRLARVAGAVGVARSPALTDQEARRLARFTTPQAAEAFFAQTIILVEGISDVIVIEALADRLGRNLDAAGIAVVPVGGARTFEVYHQLFGPRGLQIRLAGLCDEAEEVHVERALARDGHPAYLSRMDRERLGFFTCVADLEDELLRALGDAAVDALIAGQGDGPAFATYQAQLSNRAQSLHDQLLGYLHSHKIEYAPVLADAVPIASIPSVLQGLISHV